MKKLRFKILILFMGLFFVPVSSAFAQNGPESVQPDSSAKSSKTISDYTKFLYSSHFTWGVDAGSSIDLTANNLSTFDVDLIMGYKNPFIKVIGVGLGYHKAFGSSNNFIPIYAVLRTSFTSRPSKCFFNFQCGYSFNSVDDAASKGGFTLAAGIGMNIASTKYFKSHLILSYGFMHLNERQLAQISLSNENISLAKLTIGINF